jgi:hypothetical protein
MSVELPGIYFTGRALRWYVEAEVRKRLWLVGLAVLALCGISGTPTRRVAEARQNPSDKREQYRSPWQKIDEAAKLENPSDGNSAHALIDEILAYPHFFNLNLPIMREIVEQRLVQAEINYKFGRNTGIPEKSVVQIANTLADKFDLPDYSHVTVHQIEVLRLGMELSMPAFMGPASSQIEPGGVYPADANLSPAQAAHILLVLIDQKMSNPDYQLAPEEWEKTQYQPSMDRLLKYKELRDSGQLAKTEKRGALVTVVHTKDLRTPISNAVAQMSLTDGLDLVNQAFGIAGIDK